MGIIKRFLGRFVDEEIHVIGTSIYRTLHVPPILRPFYKLNNEEEFDNFKCMVDAIAAERIVYGGEYE